MKNNRGLLIILAGPSGVGKGTIRKEIFKHKDLNLAFSISLTTRKPRPGEVDGVDYYFVSQEEFDKKIKEKDFLEHAEFVNHCYGTCKSLVNKMRDEGKNVVLEIEIQGAKQIVKQFNKDEVLSFFIVPPSLEELEKRLRGRLTESDETIRCRLKTAKKELRYKKKFNHVVINDNVTRVANEISDIIHQKINIRS